MYLPDGRNIDAKVLAGVYKNTTATYKFYWFASILDILVKEGKTSMSFWEVIIGMVAQAWYPVHYFRISFGKSDSLASQIIKLQQVLNLPIDSDISLLKRTLSENLNNPDVEEAAYDFTYHVPYRFLSPWIACSSNSQVEVQSRTYSNNCIYAIGTKFRLTLLDPYLTEITWILEILLEPDAFL